MKIFLLCSHAPYKNVSVKNTVPYSGRPARYVDSFDHDANIIELASSPSTNHVEGINADNITHSNVKDILPPEAYESVRQNMDRVILTGESSTSRHDLMLDGILHHYENRIFPLDNEYLLCMCRDISEQWNDGTNQQETNKKSWKPPESKPKNRTA